MSNIDLSVEFCGVRFLNPFILAAAPPTDNGEMIMRGFEAGWGGAVCKTMAVEKEPVELVYPMISGIHFNGKPLMGMENIDLISEHKVNEWIPWIREIKRNFPNNVLIASIMASSKEDWQELVRRLEEAGVDMIECSFSCPHGMPERGMGATIGQSYELTKRTAAWVKEAAKRVPVIIKLTPNVTDIAYIAEAVKESGADGVCAINTVKALLGIDINTFAPIPTVDGKGTFGGYSGPAIKPIALKCVAEIAQKVDIPISAVGGISNWQDAVEFLLAGAQNVQICTAVMQYGFRIIDDLKDGLTNYLKEKGFSSPKDIIGRALPNIVAHQQLSRQWKVVSKINQDSCIKCDLCFIACRDGGHQAIERNEERLPSVDEEKCAGCGLCQAICPVPATILLVPKIHS